MADGRQDSFGFLRLGGELASLIAGLDWSATAIGALADWPSSLRTATGMILQSPVAMVLLWGRDGVMIYNDAYSVVAGGRHPGCLGEPVEQSWPEVADFNRHVLDVCLGGGTLSFKDQNFKLLRNGVAEEVWLDLSYSPVRDEHGDAMGVLAVVVEITRQHLADDRLRIAQAAGRFGAFEWFPDRQHLVASAAFREIFGIAADLDISDQLLLSIVVPDDRALTAAVTWPQSQSAPSYSEYRIRQPSSGDIRWIARRGEIREVGGEPRFLGVAWDITERKDKELRDAFLGTVIDRLRDLDDARDVIGAASEMLGIYLRAGRVGYAELDASTTHVIVERDWTDGGMASMAGRHRLEDFGLWLVRASEAGEIVRINDVLDDPRIAAEGVAEAFLQFGIRAGLNVPLAREGRVVGVLFAHSATARHWDQRDEVVLRDVAFRTWDAAQRVRADQLLRASEEKFRLFAQAVPNQMWTADPAGQLDWFNDQVYAYSGALPGDLDGERWGSIVHPLDLPAAIMAWTEALRHGTTYEAEFRLRGADGSVRWHIARALPIRDGRGVVTRWIGTNTDIEDQRRARAELASINARLAESVEQRTRERDRIWSLSRDPLLIADQSGVWLSASPAWTTLLGWTEAELLGRTGDWIAHPEDAMPAVGMLVQSPSGATPMRFDNRVRARDGDYRWISWTAVAEGGLLYCVARDVTAEKESAQRLQQAEEALRQAQKMEAIGQLTGGIAHDFNNMLTGIIGSLDLVRRRIATGRTRDLDRFMEAANSSAQRAAALTHRLLAFARRQSLDTKVVAVDTLMAGMEDLLRRTLGEQVSLQFVLPADLWRAMTDPNQLESAILNLAINARDAMPHGGQLTIEAANTVLDRRYTDAHHGLAPGEYVAISVTDTGVGMPKGVIEKAFEPFFTTKPVGQGTGLGLSMVYGFIRQSNGHVRIYSEPGQGATIKLFLPRATEQIEAALPTAESVPQGAGETVLVIEDDASVRLLIVEVLHELGYLALEASDADAALPIIDSPRLIDLIVTDVGLPGMNGRQLADYARGRRPDLKILFVTGYAENAAIRSGFLDKGMAMMTKPFAVEALAAKISEMMAPASQRA